MTGTYSLCIKLDRNVVDHPCFLPFRGTSQFTVSVSDDNSNFEVIALQILKQGMLTDQRRVFPNRLNEDRKVCPLHSSEFLLWWKCSAVSWLVMKMKQDDMKHTKINFIINVYCISFLYIAKLSVSNWFLTHP